MRFLMISLFFSFQVLAANPAIYIPIETHQNRCPLIGLHTKISLENFSPDYLITIPIDSNDNRETQTFELQNCGRFYDSYTCRYLSSSNEKLIIDDACSTTFPKTVPCFNVYGCSYLIPKK